MVDATVPDEVEWALPGRMTIEERTAPDRALLDALVPAPLSVVRVGRMQAMQSKLQAQTPVAQYAPGCRVGVAAVQQVTVAGDQSQLHRVSAEVQGELELKWFDLWDQPQPGDRQVSRVAGVRHRHLRLAVDARDETLVRSA
jgi:hypothetical protein